MSNKWRPDINELGIIDKFFKNEQQLKTILNNLLGDAAVDALFGLFAHKVADAMLEALRKEYRIKDMRPKGVEGVWVFIPDDGGEDETKT